MLEETIATPDGRTLAVEIAGDAEGKPVLVHMGTPNSRHLYGPIVADADARGLRLISYDRPGYGGSSAMPGRTIADCAADVRTICESLRVERAGVWGVSRGGPHGEWLSEHIPGVDARLLGGDGHLSVFTSRIGEVHSWLAERM